jgi:indole-3-acetate monooxygenase
MKYLHHPSEFLNKESIAQIRECAREAESARKLHDHQLEIIYRNKWLKMYVPKKYGGLNLSLPEILKIEECLSWVDGSTAWVVTLCSGAGWFVGFLNPQIADTIFKDDQVCIAGSGALTGVAEITETGYVLDGVWRYASGALHATAFTMNCLLTKGGHQIQNRDGSPKMASFIVMKDEVTLDATWNSMGMIATGSHSFKVNQLPVSKERCFHIDPNGVVLNEPIYRYPFLQLAETTLAVNISGMAIRFIDLCEVILSSEIENKLRDESLTQVVADARNSLNEFRQSLFTIVEESWKILVSGNEIAATMLKEISESSRRLSHNSRTRVNVLYPFCGLKAAAVDSEINRIWRNIHTAGQHTLLNK